VWALPRLTAGDLWRDPSFVLCWLARVTSLAGSAVTLTVLPILVFRMTGSAA
jgi:hypothetical protein